MKNIIGDISIVEEYKLGESIDIDECIFCSCPYVNEPYELESNRYGYKCGLRYHMSYVTIGGGSKPPNAWEVHLTVLSVCEYENVCTDIGRIF